MRIMLAVALCATLVGCQSARFGSGVDGNWASDDGVFVATFQNGAFSSRLVSTGDTVVSDGRYTATGNGLNLAWTSIAANERRGAECTFVTRTQLSCVPTQGQPFTMSKRQA